MRTPAGETPPTRFWLRVWPRGDCWEWRGTRNQYGYGLVSEGPGMGSDMGTAHRLAFVQAKGLIPVGLTIDHLCRHPWCVRPSHLEAVSFRENVLRGICGAAQNARKTHCKRGHLLSPENCYNLKPMASGTVKRRCRQCSCIARERSRARCKAAKSAT